MLFHLPGEKSPLTSSATCCTSCGKGDDGNVPLILSSVSKLVCVCVCVCVYSRVLEVVLSNPGQSFLYLWVSGQISTF